MKQRIWELDAFRGLCVLGMVAVHFVYDLVELYALVPWDYSPVFHLVKDWGGILFILLSGICATLGSRSVRRGLQVFACGMLCTAVTAGMYLLDFADVSIVIYFGVLHCLGVCMLLWPLFKKWPAWALALTGAVLAAAGIVLERTVQVSFPWLVPLGILYPGFVSSDYFPLIANLGFFLLGAFLGRTVYGKNASLFPKVRQENPLVRFFTGCGRWSLPIYLLHQPVLALLFTLVAGVAG